MDYQSATRPPQAASSETTPTRGQRRAAGECFLTPFGEDAISEKDESGVGTVGVVNDSDGTYRVAVTP